MNTKEPMSKRNNKLDLVFEIFLFGFLFVIWILNFEPMNSMNQWIEFNPRGGERLALAGELAGRAG